MNQGKGKSQKFPREGCYGSRGILTGSSILDLLSPLRLSSIDSKRLSFSRLKLHRLRLSRLKLPKVKPHRLRLYRLRPHRMKLSRLGLHRLRSHRSRLSGSETEGGGSTKLYTLRVVKNFRPGSVYEKYPPTPTLFPCLD